MTLNQFWRIIVAAKWLIAVCVIGCLGGAMIFGLRQPKVYEARARVLLAVTTPDQVTGVQTVNNKTIEPYVRTQALLAVSSRTAERVVDKLGWAANPAVIDGWQTATGGTGDIRTWAAKLVQGNMTAYALEGGGTLEIIYRAPDLDAAVAIAGIVRESFIETSLALETEAAARRADRLEELAQAAATRLATAEAELNAEEKTAGIVVNASGDDIEGLRFKSLQQTTIDARLASTQRIIGADRGVAKDLLVSELQSRLSEVEATIATTGGRYGPNNPTYISLLERRRRLQADISAANAAARAAAGNIAAVGRANVTRADAEFNREKTRVIANSPTEAKLAQARRMVELRQGEYRRLTANAAALRMQSTRSESGLVVLGDVIPEPDPVSPDLPLVFGLALAFGLGLGLTTALVLGLARREVLGREDLAFATNVPILGIVPGGPVRKRRWFGRGNRQVAAG